MKMRKPWVLAAAMLAMSMTVTDYGHAASSHQGKKHVRRPAITELAC